MCAKVILAQVIASFLIKAAMVQVLWGCWVIRYYIIVSIQILGTFVYVIWRKKR